MKKKQKKVYTIVHNMSVGSLVSYNDTPLTPNNLQFHLCNNKVVLSCQNVLLGPVGLCTVDQDNLSGLARSSANKELSWESREKASFQT